MAVGDDPLGAVKEPHGLDRWVKRGGLEVARFRDECPAAEVVNGDLRVGCLTDVPEFETAPVAEHAFSQPVDTESPATDVNGVHVAVSNLAAARLPHPVPVVVEFGTGELAQGRGPSPERGVAPGRCGALHRPANGGAAAVKDAPGEFHLTQLSLVHVPDGLRQPAPRAVLGARLTDSVQLPGNLHHPASLRHVVAHRLFHVDILASLHRPDRSEGVPMVGRRHKDDVHGFVLKNPAHVLHLRRHRPLQLAQKGTHLVGPVQIRIAHIGDVALRQARKFAGVRLTTDPATDDRRGDPRIWGNRGIPLGGVKPGGQREGGGRHEGVFKKTTPCQVVHREGAAVCWGNGSDGF